MTFLSTIRFVAAFIALLAVPSRVAGEQSAKKITFFGKVVAVHSSDGTATVKHGKILGFMDAMTMDYTILPKTKLEKLSPGDDIRATVREGDTTLYDVIVVSHAPRK